MTTTTTAHITPGDVIRYKRDGKFRVLAHVDGDRWTVEGLAGKFGGKTRTLSLDADTPVLEAAPRPVAAEPVAAEPVADVPAPAAEKPAARRNSPRRTPRTPRPAAERLPAGWVTPYALVAEINARGLYTGKSGALKPQSIYQYIFAARGTDRAFPGELINGKMAVRLTDGIAWWEAKNARAAARRKAPTNA